MNDEVFIALEQDLGEKFDFDLHVNLDCSRSVCADESDAASVRLDLACMYLKQDPRELQKMLSAIKVVETETAYRDSRCLLYTSPSPRDATLSRMPSSA